MAEKMDTKKVSENMLKENIQAKNANLQASQSANLQSSQSSGNSSSASDISMLTNENVRTVEGGNGPGWGVNPRADGDEINIPEGTGIWSGPHFKDPPPEAANGQQEESSTGDGAGIPIAPATNSGGQSSGGAVPKPRPIRKHRPGRNPRWPAIAIGLGTAAAIIVGIVANMLPCKHVWHVTETVAPLCMSDGYVISVCDTCGEEMREESKALGHDWRLTVHKDPTCLDGGWTLQSCANCGEVILEDIECTGHDFSVAVERVQVSCTEDGYEIFACSVCGEELRNDYTATGHNWLETVHQDATCTEDEYTDYVCSHCQECKTETGAEALGHYYEQTGYAAGSCTSQGYYKYTCTVCGWSYFDTFGGSHDWVPRVGMPGGGYVCTVCGETYGIVN